VKVIRLQNSPPLTLCGVGFICTFFGF